MKNIIAWVRQHGKVYACHTIGNYVFFAPLVIFLTPALHSWEGAIQYLTAAVPIALLGAYAYGMFLKYLWLPLWREDK